MRATPYAEMSEADQIASFNNCIGDLQLVVGRLRQHLDLMRRHAAADPLFDAAVALIEQHDARLASVTCQYERAAG